MRRAQPRGGLKAATIEALRKSMTYDRGAGMACHPELARRLKIDIRFCDPHAPWQRGSNANTNGLLRQFVPKGADLGGVRQTWLLET
jgi:IS30 family transposase